MILSMHHYNPRVINLLSEKARTAGVHAHETARFKLRFRPAVRRRSTYVKHAGKEIRGTVNDFTRILQVLEREAVFTVAKLVKDSAKMKLLLEGSQSF